MSERLSRYPHGYRLSSVQKRPQLHLVVGPPYSLEQVMKVCQQARPWLDCVHLRLKGASQETVILWAEKLLATGSVLPEQLVINGMPKVARCFGADLHLPESAPFVQDHPRAVGVSVHSVESAIAKEALGAAYLFFGHIYDSPSKPGLQPRGILSLCEVVKRVSLPVIAIGGVEQRRLKELAQTGCAGVAVISAIMAARDPGKTAAMIRQTLDRYWM